MNEPAFPRPLSRISEEEASSDQDGMTLRDYFAAKAMQALLREQHSLNFVVSQSYFIADLMLTERSKESEGV